MPALPPPPVGHVTPMLEAIERLSAAFERLLPSAAQAGAAFQALGGAFDGLTAATDPDALLNEIQAMYDRSLEREAILRQLCDDAHEPELDQPTRPRRRIVVD